MSTNKEYPNVGYIMPFVTNGMNTHLGHPGLHLGHDQLNSSTRSALMHSQARLILLTKIRSSRLPSGYQPVK